MSRFKRLDRDYTRTNKWKDKTRLKICALFQEVYNNDPRQAVTSDFLESLTKTANCMQQFESRINAQSIRQMLVQQGVYPAPVFLDAYGGKLVKTTGTIHAMESLSSTLDKLGAHDNPFLVTALKSHLGIKKEVVKKQHDTVPVTEYKREFLDKLPEQLASTINNSLSAKSILALKAELT